MDLQLMDALIMCVATIRTEKTLIALTAVSLLEPLNLVASTYVLPLILHAQVVLM